MLDFLKNSLLRGKNLFNKKPKKINDFKSIEIITCSLFIEAAKSDFMISEEEKSTIKKILKKTFSLSDAQVLELFNISQERVEKSIGLFEFTDTLNKSLTDNEKFELMKNLWRILFADEKLSKYEEHLARIINNNLNLSHKDFIASKLIVKKDLGIGT
ncbi:TerB family tellurite resistance protein [Melioribacteraceae bacterium 4301-Me]|uniref:tellurite resistance TerB family protein n=1 Tax=Pyranulibacter aquaticus TaxID=3163344 RepID=UPI0035986EFC